MKIKERTGQKERERREIMVEGHQSLCLVGTEGSETFKCPVLSDHKSNNVRQKQIAEWS